MALIKKSDTSMSILSINNHIPYFIRHEWRVSNENESKTVGHWSEINFIRLHYKKLNEILL